MPSAAGSTGGKTLLSLRLIATNTVETSNAAPAIAAGIESIRVASVARASRSPVVFSVRYVAPWNANRSTTARPATTV